ncbi:hypothetical protein WJX72_012551 [[Myrmecia] bisecta]|uniref:Probable RNA polymerase II nuclear localization protein SLC7A6OS n=1 Tax=[Myrmecia] bisecta TaxID=41462 RepID=A0AAW1PM80_9CHLO
MGEQKLILRVKRKRGESSADSIGLEIQHLHSSKRRAIQNGIAGRMAALAVSADAPKEHMQFARVQTFEASNLPLGEASAVAHLLHRASAPEAEQPRSAHGAVHDSPPEAGPLQLTFEPKGTLELDKDCRLYDFVQVASVPSLHQPGAVPHSQAGVVSDESGDQAADASSTNDDYVYDVYTVVDFASTDMQGPVVQVLADDWHVFEDDDLTSEQDQVSEDSNAEGFYAHDYPEEEVSSSVPSADSDADVESWEYESTEL